MGGYNGLRKAYYSSKSNIKKKLLRFLKKGLEQETGSYLPFETKIASSINFYHGTYGIFISGGASIGKNCTIFQQVTIGSNMLLDSKGFGCPIIGDNCLIGAGAKIIGNISIGNNCRIGANAVVTVNVPDNSTIVMGKPLILRHPRIENKIYQKNNKNIWGYLEKGTFIEETNPKILDELRHKEG